MKNIYKIILSNKNVYREIELTPDTKKIQVGTGVDCDVRIHKDLFFEPIELVFFNNNDSWSVICSDNLYLTVGDIRKLMTKSLNHGDSIEVKYQASDNVAFSLEFLIDFGSENINYNRCIDVSALGKFLIGQSKNDNIIISGQYINNDEVIIGRVNNGYALATKSTTYGVFINGKKVTKRQEKLENGDFFSISDFFFYFKDGKLWTEKREDMSINGLSYHDEADLGSYPKFYRNIRIKTVVNDEKIEILDPPTKPQKPKNNLIMRLMPSFGMLIAAGVMAFFGRAMIIMSAVSGLMAIFTTIMSIREGKKDYNEGIKERLEKYNSYIEKKRQEITDKRNTEKEELEQIYISQDSEKKRFASFSSDLFDRSSEDEDFLCVRLGSGDITSIREINYKKQERLEVDDELQEIPEQIYEEYKNVINAPVYCDFKSVNSIGIVGSISNRFSIFKNIVIDLIARHYYTDVKMVFVASKEHKNAINWLRFLPNAYNDVLGIRNIVCDDDSKTLIFEYLYKELTIREQNKHYDDRIVVFFYDEYGFKNHPLSKFVDKAKNLGVTFVFFGENKSDIPQGCGYIVSIDNEKSGSLIDITGEKDAVNFEFPIIGDKQAVEIVYLMAPVYTDEISLEGTLTKNISLFELLNILAVDDLDLGKRWASTQVVKSMSAPIGVTKSGVVNLDLHDSAHGPHGLVAGTTGSGKSEILQTYVLSMATLYSPYEIGFVIIDFKGGGMANQFKDLPHLLGTITNIDGKEINRSLKSIKAELQKRQCLFAEADVNHIDKYIKKYNAGEVSVPLPHLIIIVDEFAELKAEQPEFMKELISAARIGRSLGVHLILATQKPSGQVNEQIWSNSRFKLCLKVQSQEDSNEVLKSPLAAEIKEPGRAYLQVGNNEIFELFQSAYSGAPEKTIDSNVKEFTIYNFNESGRKAPIYIQKKNAQGDGSQNQLEAIVKYVNNYCNSINLKKLSDICLPSLNRIINFNYDISNVKNGYFVELGVYDDPDNQYQGEYSIDLSSNNMMLIGSSQSGKTNVLQTIIRSLTTKFTPKEVSIYIIDFASMILKNFESLNHVGGVVCQSEDEKLKNLFKLLSLEIEKRKTILLNAGVSSFSSYKEAGMNDLPLVVLIIDNLTALREMYFQDDTELLNIFREGLTVGISVVVANSQTAGIGYRYFSNFSSKIALFCNDSNEYSSLFDHCREKIDNIPGRALVEIEKNHFDCQMYLPFVGDKEIDRVNSIRNYIQMTNKQNDSLHAKRIPEIPDILTESILLNEYNAHNNLNSFVIGLNYASVSPIYLNFFNQSYLGITGSNDKNKARFIDYIVKSLIEIGSELIVLDDFSEILYPISNNPCVSLYSRNLSDIKEMFVSFKDGIVSRYAQRELNGRKYIEQIAPLVFIINNYDAIREISDDSLLLNEFKEISKKYSGLKAFFIFTNIKNDNIPYSSPEVLKMIKDNNQWIVFENISNIKVFDCPLSLTKKFSNPLGENELFYLNGNELAKIKSIS